MGYVKQLWANGATGSTPINAARLSYMEDGIEAAGSAIPTSSITYVTPNTGLDVSVAMQNFLDAWATNKGMAVLAPGTYICNSPLRFNHPVNTARADFILFAYGARITSTYAGVILGDDLPADSTAAATLLGRRISIHGLTIVGNYPGTSQTGIRLACRSWPQLVDVQVEVCDTNFDMIFCLMGQVSHCYSAYPKSYGFRLRSGAGLWTGATGPNSASNHTCFTNGTRDYAQAGQLAQFYVEDSQGVVLRDCVTEGENPVNAIHYSTIIHDTVYGHTGGRTFKIDNHHAENFPTNAHIRADAYSGHVIIGQFDSQTGGVLIDGSLSSITTVIDATLPTIVSAPTFKTAVGGPRWVFNIPSNYGSVNLADSSYWVGALVGTMGGIRFNDATAEAAVTNIGLGISGGTPWMHGTDIFMLSDRTTLNVPGIHLNGATEIGVYDNGPVGGAFLANSRLCPSLDTGSNILWTAKQSNGVVRFASLPQVVQNLLGWIFTRKTSAPADGDLAANELTLWFDSTAGAAKLMIKAKNASGTVVTGSVNLT